MPRAGISNDPAEDRGHERVEDAQRRAGEAGKRSEPEELLVGEGEADRRQLGHDDRPHHPHREGQEQAGNRNPQIAPRDGAASVRPERWILGAPILDRARGRQRALPGRRMDRLHFRKFGKRRRRRADRQRSALHLPDRDVHPHQRDGNDQEQQPEAALPDAGQVVERAEGDGQHEAAETANETDHAAHRADAIGIVDGDVLVDGGLAQAHEEAEHEDDDDETG
jgi:hypothetical protein